MKIFRIIALGLFFCFFPGGKRYRWNVPARDWYRQGNDAFEREEYGKAAADIKKSQALGFPVNPEMVELLLKVTGGIN